METKRKYVNLVITGNPGVGKHTTAELILKQNSSYEMIDINKFAIDEGFAEKLENGFEIDTTKLKDEIKGIISDRSLIVGHLAPYVIDEIDVDLVIVLRKNPYDLIEVYKKRDYQDSKIKQNTGSEILGVIVNDSIQSFGKEKTFEINTTDRSPEDVVKIINEIIQKKNNGEIIDWLELIKKKNDFNKFF